MSQVPVKWANANSLKDNAGKCDCDVGSTGPVPVVPLSALREMVEGLRKHGAEFGSENYGYNKALNDLLVLLGEGK